MSWLLLVRHEAERDLANARDWYERKRPGLGDEFLDEIALAMREMETHPEMPRLFFENFRRILLRRFPYKIFYQVVGDRVIVFRVIHAKQEHSSHLPPDDK
jgi:plasmid stabilization system protein ParE